MVSDMLIKTLAVIEGAGYGLLALTRPCHEIVDAVSYAVVIDKSPMSLSHEQPPLRSVRALLFVVPVLLYVSVSCYEKVENREWVKDERRMHTYSL